MRRIFLLALFAACLIPLAAAVAASGQDQKPIVGASSEPLMNVPVSGVQIAPQAPNIKNPYAGDKNALVEGEKLFHAMNCVGCHAPEGGGGMGPALSDNVWKYGSSPGDLYLTIQQGRPNGMPAWGGALPPQAIWYLVTYVKTLSQKAAAYEQPSKLNMK